MPEPLQPFDPDLYDHLRALARRIYGERGHGHQSIQPTVLLHEAWIKLDRSQSEFESRAHFMATAARAMRQILTDRARAQAAEKRGGPEAHRTTLTGLGEEQPDVDVLALSEALEKLAELDADAAEVVTMRTFGGMTVPEVAEALGTSTRSVERTWRFARAFLANQLR